MDESKYLDYLSLVGRPLAIMIGEITINLLKM